MSYSLDDFCVDARTILADSDDAAGRERIRRQLELLLPDAGFRTEHLGPDAPSGMRQLHEDAEQGFCVLVYSMDADRTSPPHDHGSSWAVYGQVAGHTDMTLWASEGEDPGALAPTRSFRLDPGQAGLFDIGEVHSISYPAGARFVRVTGVDLARETRRVFDPVAGTLREIEGVGVRDERRG